MDHAENLKVLESQSSERQTISPDYFNPRAPNLPVQRVGHARSSIRVGNGRRMAPLTPSRWDILYGVMATTAVTTFNTSLKKR